VITAFVHGVLLYLLPGVVFATFLEPEDTEQSLTRWLLTWPGCIVRERQKLRTQS